jgi:hypothetical protein
MLQSGPRIFTLIQRYPPPPVFWGMVSVGIQGCMVGLDPVPVQDVPVPVLVVLVVMWPLLGDAAKPGHFCHILQFLPL